MSLAGEALAIARARAWRPVWLGTIACFLALEAAEFFLVAPPQWRDWAMGLVLLGLSIGFTLVAVSAIRLATVGARPPWTFDRGVWLTLAVWLLAAAIVIAATDVIAPDLPDEEPWATLASTPIDLALLPLTPWLTHLAATARWRLRQAPAFARWLPALAAPYALTLLMSVSAAWAASRHGLGAALPARLAFGTAEAMIAVLQTALLTAAYLRVVGGGRAR